MTTDLLGQGMAFPLRTNALGSVEMSRELEKVRQSILTILGTQHYERVMRPLFGCNLKSLVHAPNNAATANLARHYVTEGLKRWEPRINLKQVVVENDNQTSQLIISIHYQIKTTNDVLNLIYPFYLDAL